LGPHNDRKLYDVGHRGPGTPRAVEIRQRRIEVR
jgi:hypothetical protein